MQPSGRVPLDATFVHPSGVSGGPDEPPASHRRTRPGRDSHEQDNHRQAATITRKQPAAASNQQRLAAVNPKTCGRSNMKKKTCEHSSPRHRTETNTCGVRHESFLLPRDAGTCVLLLCAIMSEVQLTEASDDFVHSELLQFCLASLAHEREQDATAAERREARERMKTHRALLVEEMRRAGITLARMPRAGVSDEWAVLKPKTKPERKLCAGSVAELLEGLDSADLRQRVQGGGLLPAIESFLRDKLKPHPTGDFTVILRRRREGGPVQKPPALPLPPAVVRAASDLAACADQARVHSADLKKRVEPHKETRRRAEAAVGTYIDRVSPSVGVAPLQVEMRGEARKFFVRRVERRQSPTLTLPKLLTFTTEALADVLSAARLPYDVVTDAAVARLQEAPVRDMVFQRLQLRIDQHRAEGVRVSQQVRLEKGMPRVGKRQVPSV